MNICRFMFINEGEPAGMFSLSTPTVAVLLCAIVAAVKAFVVLLSVDCCAVNFGPGLETARGRPMASLAARSEPLRTIFRLSDTSTPFRDFALNAWLAAEFPQLADGLEGAGDTSCFLAAARIAACDPVSFFAGDHC